MRRSPDGRGPEDIRRTWFSPRAIAMHLTLILVVPVFAGLFWWQVQRVRQGNTLSWAYVFEWPFFAGYAVYMWWRLVHDQAELSAETLDETTRTAMSEGAAPGPGSGIGPAPGAGESAPAALAGVGTATEPDEEASQDDQEMAAYNRYLAELDTSGRRKRW